MKIIDPNGLRARHDRWGEPSALRPRRALGARLLWAAFPLAVAPLLIAGDAEPEAPMMVSGPEVASRLDPSLPLEVNRRVASWAERFQTAEKAAFQRLLDRRGLYAQMIRGKLRERGMPEELIYVAMMESGLSPVAVSHASAVGLWQFMGPTAQQYGLRVDEWVDERRDPVRATDAALDYIGWLYERYGSWYLAAAAYNAGPGRLDRILARHAQGRSGDDEIYWEVLPHLPRETREYVPRVIAAALLGEDPSAYGFAESRAEPADWDRVFVPGATTLRAVARSLKVEERALRALNPHLLRGVTPPDETYPLRVPSGTSAAVVASLTRPSATRLADD